VLLQQKFAAALMRHPGSGHRTQEQLGLLCDAPREACLGPTALELLDATCDSDGVLRASVVCRCQHCEKRRQNSNAALHSSAAPSPTRQIPAGAQQHGADNGSQSKTKNDTCLDLRSEAGEAAQGGAMVLAVLNTGAYQDALASKHNLFGEPETWYVMESSAAAGSCCAGEQLRLVHEDSGIKYIEFAAGRHNPKLKVVAEAQGLQLPEGWDKGRGTWLYDRVTSSGSYRIIAAVRAGENVADVVRAVGMAVPAGSQQLGTSQTSYHVVKGTKSYSKTHQHVP
jgi:hypothetical protein